MADTDNQDDVVEGDEPEVTGTEPVVEGEKTEVDGDIVEPATEGGTVNPVAGADAEPATEDAEGGCEHCAHKDGCCEDDEDKKPVEPDTEEVE